jgi:Dual specificity phosphatase, catalytic domain
MRRGIAPRSKRLRSDVVLSGVRKAMKSRFAQFVFLLTLTAALAVRLESLFFKALLVLPVALAVVSYKVLLFELSMSMNMVQSLFGYWSWFNLVHDSLYIGAVPMQPMDPPIISKKLHVNALLCTMESDELTLNSLFGSSVSPQVWRQLEIDYQHLPLSEYRLPSFEALTRGASFLNLHLAENRRVYVYCRSGCSQSACVVLAYFIRHLNMNAREAYDKLTRKRRVNFRWGSQQANNLVAYEKSLRGNET